MFSVLLLAQQAAASGTDRFDWVALFVGVITVMAAVFTATWATRDAVKARREQHRHELARQHGEALSTAIAWAETPYRIARRTSDGPEALQLHATHMHDLQERIVYHQQWLRVESPAIAETYDRLVAAVKRITGPHLQAAWQRPATVTPEQMNLGALYPCEVTKECQDFVAAVRRELKLELRRQP